MQWFYKIGTLILLVVIAALIGGRMLQKTSRQSDDTESASSDSAFEAPPQLELLAQARRREQRKERAQNRRPSAFDVASESLQFGDQGRSDAMDTTTDAGEIETTRGPSLRIGVIGSTPQREEVLTIAKLPFSPAQVRSAFRAAQRRTCRMVLPDVVVRAPAPRLEPGRAATLGRIPALSVGLTLAPSGSSKLTNVVRNQVVEYFREHRLSIQPTIHVDARGQLYFDTDCQAAFYELKRPGFTIQPEPLITKSVNEFRAIGVSGKVDQNQPNLSVDEKGFGRTLVMAFSFARETRMATGIGAGKDNTIEYLFLHLPDYATANDLEIQVFATDDGRSTLHKIASVDGDLAGQMPTMTASIRFDSTVLMGMYPADPVVTELRYRSIGVMSMETVRELISVRKGDDAQSLTQVLDSFGELSSR